MFVVCEAVVAGMNVGVGVRFGKFSKLLRNVSTITRLWEKRERRKFLVRARSFVSASVLCKKKKKIRYLNVPSKFLQLLRVSKSAAEVGTFSV